ncbi:MAG: hypothetical protein OEZ59_06440 [Deltaproteobacteria bacterium]|nr:hypothetical protein [Deltaproteobacteria bacterium]
MTDTFLAVLAAMVFMAGCSSPPADDGGGETTPDAYSSSMYNIVQNPTACDPVGGYAIDYGLDTDLSGDLENPNSNGDNEIIGTANICNGQPGNNGTNGLDSYVTVTTEVAGSNCDAGGVRVDSGLDADDSGALDQVEITSTEYVCNGTGGTAGTSDGTLVTITPDSVTCTTGGVKVYSWTDANSDGVEDAGETTTDYICNGAIGSQGLPGDPGADGLSFLFEITTEAPGANCSAGGYMVQAGPDTNGDQSLDTTPVTGEVTHTRYLCHGADALVDAVDAGAACSYGGTRIYWGSDMNDNGTLDTTERDDAVGRLLCNGANSLVLTTPITGDDINGCPMDIPGVKITTGVDLDNDGALISAGETAYTSAVCSQGTTASMADASASMSSRAKSDLEAYMALKETPPNKILDLFTRFDQAYMMDPANEEAALYSSLFQFPLFLDSSASTGLFHQMGLLAMRYEFQLCDGYEDYQGQVWDDIMMQWVTVTQNDCPFVAFEPPVEPYFGGAVSDVSFADLKNWVSGTNNSLRAATKTAATRLAGISPSHSSTLLDRREGLVELDDTDVNVFRSIADISQLPFLFNDLYTAPNVDSFLDNAVTRTPTGGVEKTAANTLAMQDYLRTGNDQNAGTTDTLPLSKNDATATELLNTYTSAVTNLRTALDGLTSEVDDQSDDLIIYSEEFPSYNKRNDVERERMLIIRDALTSLETELGGTPTGTVTIPEPIVKVTNFDQCNPADDTATASYSDPRNRSWGGDMGDLTGVPVTALTLNSTGQLPGSPHTDGAYYFTLNLTSAKNLSIFTRDVDSNIIEVSTSADVGYAIGAPTPLVPLHWDSDWDSGYKNHFGISIDADWFNASYLPTPGASPNDVTLYIRVMANSNEFRIFAWDETQPGVPVFLRDNAGRNHELWAYNRSGAMNPKNLIAVMAEMLDNTNRSTLVLDNPETDLVNESFMSYTGTATSLQEQIQRVFPAATVTITDGNDADGTADNLQQDQVEVSMTDFDNLTPGAVKISFCAPGWQFYPSWNVEGGRD